VTPRTKNFLSSLVAPAALGALFGLATGAALLKPPLLGAVIAALASAIDITAMAGLIRGAETFLPATPAGRAMARMPFLGVLAIKTLLYGSVIVAIVAGRLGPNVVALLVGEKIAGPLYAQLDAAFPVGLLIPTAFLIAFFSLLTFQMRLLIGANALRDIVLGRYHRARLEERFFLFVDIVGSTPLAERLGPVAVNRFLARVFELASDPVDEHAGEIYQYVGDEMVVTWKLGEGRLRARPLGCYFAIESALADRAGEFAREFGAMPRLRGALHAGEVITGEVGGSRRAIVFHGDVMNTTSRIENATRELGRPFLVSEEALRRLEGAEAYAMTDLGPQRLRGREGLLRLYAVDAAARTS
jgi:adenylate cyclase